MYNQHISSDHKIKMIEFDNSIKANLINDKIIEFSLNPYKVTLPSLPVNLRYLLENNIVFLISNIDISINARKLFLHKITGTYKKLLLNAIAGVKKPYEIKLSILGVGYKFYDEQQESKRIKVAIGYSHPVYINIMSNINIILAKDSVNIIIIGADKQRVGEMASKFLSIKKFNRYSMSGIKYTNKKIIKKEINKKA